MTEPLGRRLDVPHDQPPPDLPPLDGPTGVPGGEPVPSREARRLGPDRQADRRADRQRRRASWRDLVPGGAGARDHERPLPVARSPRGVTFEIPVSDTHHGPLSPYTPSHSRPQAPIDEARARTARAGRLLAVTALVLLVAVLLAGLAGVVMALSSDAVARAGATSSGASAPLVITGPGPADPASRLRLVTGSGTVQAGTTAAGFEVRVSPWAGAAPVVVRVTAATTVDGAPATAVLLRRAVVATASHLSVLVPAGCRATCRAVDVRTADLAHPGPQARPVSPPVPPAAPGTGTGTGAGAGTAARRG